MIDYEWLVETVDVESNDIIDVDHRSSAAEALRVAARTPEPGTRYDVGICRDTYYPDDSRSWAYLDARGDLPEFFTDAMDVKVAKVPKRYHAELAKAKAQQNKALA